MWTQFMDMHSGGGLKEKWQYIYIEAPEQEAKAIFYNRFGHNPDRVTCTCCGEDYSTNESDSLEQATGFERGCDYENGKYVERQRTKYSFHTYQTLEEYLKKDSVLVIRDQDIKPEERLGEPPEQGYVWV